MDIPDNAINCGTYSFVCDNKDGTVTKKFMNEWTIYGPEYLREVSALHKLRDCEYVVNFHGIDKEGGIILEKFDGDLTIIPQEKVTYSFARRVIKAVATALNYGKANGVMHRDIKPQNILIKDYRKSTEKIVICDYNLSRFFPNPNEQPDSITPSDIQTPKYKAPEVVDFEKYGSYTYNIDVWSLGITIIHLLGFNDLESMKKVAPLDLCSIVSKMVTVDPKYRITCREILKTMGYKYIVPLKKQITKSQFFRTIPHLKNIRNVWVNHILNLSDMYFENIETIKLAVHIFDRMFSYVIRGDADIPLHLLADTSYLIASDIHDTFNEMYHDYDHLFDHEIQKVKEEIIGRMNGFYTRSVYDTPNSMINEFGQMLITVS